MKTFPQLLNLENNYKNNTDGNLLLQHGFWNDELAKQWVSESDYVLTLHEDHIKEELWNKADFELIPITQPNFGCYPEISLQIYKRR